MAVNYFALPGLSHSHMKDLEVSPLRYWYRHLRPDREPEEETAALRFGSALHCAVLEPSQFDSRYCREAEKPEGCLDKADDLKGWLRERSITPKGTRKDGWIAQVLAIDSSVPILDILRERHNALNAGKKQLGADEWARLVAASVDLRSEPRLNGILKSGAPEVEFSVADPETGVLLKAKMDWVSETHTLDLKTFVQQRGNSIDVSVANAIYYEKYYRQAFFYSTVRAIAEGDKRKSGPQKAPPFVIAFVESDPPHETRLKLLSPKIQGEVCMYWEKARFEVRKLIRLYADCLNMYGDGIWRSARDIDDLYDQEMKGLAYD